MARLNKTKGSKAPAWFAALITTLLSLSAGAEINFTGYAKSFAIAQDSLDNDFISAPAIYQSQNSLRLMLEGFGTSTVWQIHYELSPVLVSRDVGLPVQTFNVVGDSYRYSDIKSPIGNAETKTEIYQNLDRFNVQFQFDAGDLTIGRQAISFGSARMINPTDVFLPFDVQTFNTEYRTGVDAIRFQRPVGELGEIDLGIVLGPNADSETSAAFLQLRGNVSGNDLHFALIEYAEQSLIGVGLQRALGDLGFWFEAARVTGDQDYTRISTGLDYAFSEFTFGQIEYHYNGAGNDDPADYIAAAASLPYQRGGVFLYGRDYLIPSFSAQVSPLLSLSAAAIINLSDDSAFLNVAAEYNIAEDFYMDFGWYHFVGDDLETNNLGLPELGSEYGTSPDMLYTSIRFYF